ncbi:MAG: type II toxin-antitoxin system RatA family toxin, partial [Bacteriovoracia bacterium]
MPEITRSEVFDVPIEKIYQVIVNYENYPEFVEGVDEIEILKQNTRGATVKYSLNMIKKLSYVLEMKHKKNSEVCWKLKEGDLFKVNEG